MQQSLTFWSGYLNGTTPLCGQLSTAPLVDCSAVLFQHYFKEEELHLNNQTVDQVAH